jgi:2'-5' RNA ligase
MHGLVSLLDPEYYAKVEAIWQELKDDCGLTGIYITPLPHFSWQIAEDYDWIKLESFLTQIAADTKPFSVKTCGLALFTGDNPIIYIPVVRTRTLTDLHQLIWDRITPISAFPSLLYSPSFWMPHISLAYKDIALEGLHCLMDKLTFRTFNWEIQIDNLSLIYEPDGSVGTQKYHFALDG